MFDRIKLNVGSQMFRQKMATRTLATQLLCRVCNCATIIIHPICIHHLCNDCVFRFVTPDIAPCSVCVSYFNAYYWSTVIIHCEYSSNFIFHSLEWTTAWQLQIANTSSLLIPIHVQWKLFSQCDIKRQSLTNTWYFMYYIHCATAISIIRV